MVGVPRSSAVRLLRRLLTRFPVAVAAAAIVTPQAIAAAPAFTNSCADDINAAICERIDYMIQQNQEMEWHVSLAWWGVWTAAGLLIVLLIAPMFVDAFRFWR